MGVSTGSHSYPVSCADPQPPHLQIQGGASSCRARAVGAAAPGRRMESGKGVGPVDPGHPRRGLGPILGLLWRRTKTGFVGEASGHDLAETQDQSQIRVRTICHGGRRPGGPGTGWLPPGARVPTTSRQGLFHQADGGQAQALSPGGQTPTPPHCRGGQRGALPGPSAELSLRHPLPMALTPFLRSAGSLHAQPKTSFLGSGRRGPDVPMSLVQPARRGAQEPPRQRLPPFRLSQRGPQTQKPQGLARH